MGLTSVVHLNQVSNVKLNGDKASSKPILLIETLKLLLTMLKFTGIRLDWETNSMASSPLINVIKKLFRIFVMFLAFLILFGYASFMLFKIIVRNSEIDLINDSYSSAMMISILLRNLLFAIPLINNSLNLLFFAFIRGKLVKMIQDFDSFESQYILHTEITKNTFDILKKRRRIGFITVIFTNFAMCLSYNYIHFLMPYVSVFFINDETMCSIFSIPVLLMVEVVSTFFVMLLHILVDLIPPLIYFHSGAAMRVINDEINDNKETLFSNQDVDEKMNDHHLTLLQIWSKYDGVRQLVKRADELFGWMLLFDFGIKFFMVCLLSYALLTTSQYNSASATIACFFAMIAYTIRIVNTVFLLSEVQESRELLTSQMSSHRNNYLLDMAPQMLKVFSAFKSEVKSDQLAASPLGLFTVNPALMLTMLSLIVTCLVILIQFN